MANFHFGPGGFELEEDEDDYDGFVLDNDYGQAFKPTQSDPVKTNPSSAAPRGGFGQPSKKQTPQEPERKFRYASDLKNEAETLPLNVGDFQMAIVRGHGHVVQQYLSNGFGVDEVLKSGWTGLMYAASNANLEITSLLLDKGADPNSHKDMYTVLMAACGAGGYSEADVLAVVNLLLDRGAEASAFDRYHTTPLMYAAREGRPLVIERLVQAGADVNRQDRRGLTGLTWAVTKGHKAAARALMQLKADPLKKHGDGQTVIDLAELNDDLEMLEILEGKKRDSTLVSAPTIPAARPKPVSSRSSNSLKDSCGTTYGELELFLCGLDLSGLIDMIRDQHIDFNTFLKMSEEDLIKIGISQLGVRKKIMDGIHSVHKREWEKSSLPTLQYNKQVSCGEALAIVANISKHTKYITTTMDYLKSQISKNPKILEQLQDGTGPKQLQQHTVDTLTNVTALQHTLDSLKTKLTNMIERGNYDPPDVLHDPTPPQKTRRWSSISVLVGVVVSGVVVWRTLVLWRYGNILHGITGNRT